MQQQQQHSWKLAESEMSYRSVMQSVLYNTIWWRQCWETTGNNNYIPVEYIKQTSGNVLSPSSSLHRVWQNQALPTWLCPKPFSLSFTLALQKPVGNVTRDYVHIYTVYAYFPLTCIKKSWTLRREKHFHLRCLIRPLLKAMWVCRDCPDWQLCHHFVSLVVAVCSVHDHHCH